MEVGNEMPIDVRLNEWSFDDESAGFMLKEGGVIVVYLWQRGVVPSVIEGESRAAIESTDPIYVYHPDVLGAEEVDPATASCFASDEDGVVRCYGGPIPDDQVMEILTGIDPGFRKADGTEFKLA